MHDWPTWQQLLTLLGSTGLLAMAGAGIKAVWEHLTGAHERRMVTAHAALDALGEAGRMGAEYWRLRQWCISAHGPDERMPAPPEDLHH